MNKERTDAGSPFDSLRPGRVHEIAGPAAAAFAILSLRGRSVAVCAPDAWLQALNPHGLSRLVAPDAFLHVACRLGEDALWAAETALRSGGVEAVLLVAARTPGLTPLRRLQLAAAAGGSLGLVLAGRPSASSAAETRWWCAPRFVERADSTRLHASLYKNKRGTIGSWDIDVAGWLAPGLGTERGLADALADKDASPHAPSATAALRVDAAPAGEPVRPDRIAG